MFSEFHISRARLADSRLARVPPREGGVLFARFARSRGPIWKEKGLIWKKKGLIWKKKREVHKGVGGSLYT
ncbi:hypothetical protein DU35_00090 [Methanosarcina mazei]|uniref:Uncharacterized protein n=1 Tax=Methanosarcina mazei TaxID=2209 RepID=A0A0F8EPT8_METMZ|nr:hypothetical protein DU35_00090 [Methanosarcina mazei]